MMYPEFHRTAIALRPLNASHCEKIKTQKNLTLFDNTYPTP